MLNEYHNLYSIDIFVVIIVAYCKYSILNQFIRFNKKAGMIEFHTSWVI